MEKLTTPRGGYDLNLLSDEEKLQFCAYQHAFRRIYAQDIQQEYDWPTIDPERKYFDEALVEEAVRAERRYSRSKRESERISPAMQAFHRGEGDLSLHFDDQDRERRKGLERIEREGAFETDGKTRSQAALDFAALCVRQADANVKYFLEHNRHSRGRKQ